MHDLIKDMALEIVRQESPLQPGKRSRLWFYEDVLQVLENNAGSDKIEGIMLNYLPPEKVVQLNDKAFKKMKSLRILITMDGYYNEVIKHLPSSLRVLVWTGYPSRCLPPDSLNLRSSCLILDKFKCEGHGQLQLAMSSNKIQLHMSSCNLTYEHLVICLIGFAKVVHLDLSHNNFTVLPECIKECIHLKTLLLTDCKQLRDILVIPPKLDDIDAMNCTSLTSQSSRVLLSQAFHETGDKIMMLPGSTIPEWFDHCTKERSIIFWSREEFPKICVCAAFGVLENPAHCFQVRLCIGINGEQTILSTSCYSWSIVTDHIWLFDLRVLVNNSNLRGTFMGRDWNHVEVSFRDCHVHGEYSMAIVKWYGIHVFRQESCMDNILFTNAKILQESSATANFERFSEGNYMVAQSRDDGAFHEAYYHNESDDDLQISCYPLSKRCCR
ncbi:hypothetical protein RIF29_39617 [Crotalaria pallida]|uniref:Disease resistance protein RPS4B/Roq1-like leucine-rich repeats domain-containing protein n=1 Tax=Crotalaria pallida TaxID=3830 RepID=A0AAN9E2C9_CROPI